VGWSLIRHPCKEGCRPKLLDLYLDLLSGLCTGAGKWLRKNRGFLDSRFLGFKKPLKNLKSPKFRFFNIFFGQFLYRSYKVHILIVICEFCYML